MLKPHWQERLVAPARTLQILVGALAAGCLGFMAVAVTLVGQNGPAARPAETPVVSYLALSFVAVVLFARIVVGVAITRRGCDRVARGDVPPSDPSASDEDDLAILMQIYQAKTIVGAAMLEGVSFFLLIAYLVEGLPIALGAAVATIIGVVLHFPTPARVAAWIESKSLWIDQQRQFGQQAE